MCIVSDYLAEIYLSYMYVISFWLYYQPKILPSSIKIKCLAQDFYSEAPFPAAEWLASLLVVAKGKHKNNKYDTEYITLDFTLIEKETSLFLV